MVSIAVIGLGNFGCRVLDELIDSEADIIIIDRDREIVEKYKERVRDAYITDAINSIIAVAEKGKAFNRYYIGSGEPKPLREFLLEMRDIVDPEAELGLGDIPFKGVDISYSQFDLKKVERDTGYKNEVPFAEGIRMTAEYIRGEA